jgi:hypothetical protein
MRTIAGLNIRALATDFDGTVREVIEELNLDLQVIANKGALMILPHGVDKASGLRAALSHLALEPSQILGIGDAENDSAFLEICGFSVAVSNALPSLKETVDKVTKGGHGDGVAEMIELLLRDVIIPEL